MRLICAVAISLWLGAGAGAVSDDYAGDWWVVWLGVGIVLMVVTTLYVRRPTS